MYTISTPAAAGPTIRLRFMAELLREIAFIRVLSRTISEMIACLLGRMLLYILIAWAGVLGWDWLLNAID